MSGVALMLRLIHKQGTVQELSFISCTEERAQCLATPEICSLPSTTLNIALQLLGAPTGEPAIETSGDPDRSVVCVSLRCLMVSFSP